MIMPGYRSSNLRRANHTETLTILFQTRQIEVALGNTEEILAENAPLRVEMQARR